MANNIKAIVWIAAIAFGFFFLIHADYAKTAASSTVQYWIAGILLGVCALSAIIGFSSEGRRK